MLSVARLATNQLRAHTEREHPLTGVLGVRLSLVAFTLCSRRRRTTPCPSSAAFHLRPRSGGSAEALHSGPSPLFSKGRDASARVHPRARRPRPCLCVYFSPLLTLLASLPLPLLRETTATSSLRRSLSPLPPFTFSLFGPKIDTAMYATCCIFFGGDIHSGDVGRLKVVCALFPYSVA